FSDDLHVLAALVVQDEDLNGQSLARCGRQLHRRHPKAAIAGDGDRLPTGKRTLSTERRRDGPTHRLVVGWVKVRPGSIALERLGCPMFYHRNVHEDHRVRMDGTT